MDTIEALQKKYPIDHPPHFFGFFDQHIAPYRTVAKKVLEIGVSQNSLRLWRDYFPNAEIYGVDTDHAFESFNEERIKVMIGNQKNVAFLDHVVAPCGPFDVIIDDGGHHMDEQTVSLRRLYGGSLNKAGWYVIDGLYTSYWPNYGGGYDLPGTTMWLLKRVLDQLHFSYHDVRFLDFPYVQSMHFYDGTAFIQKKAQY